MSHETVRYTIYAGTDPDPTAEPEAFRNTLEACLGGAGIEAYSIEEVHGCWQRQREPGFRVEVIAESTHSAGTIAYRVAEAAGAYAFHAEQDEVWVTEDVVRLARVRRSA